MDLLRFAVELFWIWAEGQDLDIHFFIPCMPSAILLHPSRMESGHEQDEGLRTLRSIPASRLVSDPAAAFAKTGFSNSRTNHKGSSSPSKIEFKASTTDLEQGRPIRGLQYPLP